MHEMLRRISIFASMIAGVAIVLYVLLFNLGPPDVGTIALTVIGLFLLASAIIAWRLGQWKYLIAAWGLYVGATSGPSIAIVDQSSQMSDFMLETELAAGVFLVGFAMLILVLISSGSNRNS